MSPAKSCRSFRWACPIPKAVKPGRPNPPVVLCPADLLAVKGHRYLLEAWKLVQNRGSSAGLWLAGEGELRENLQALAAELQLGDSVRFLGTLKHEALLNLYKRGSISAVTLASVDLGGGCHEGVPVALVEAMSLRHTRDLYHYRRHSGTRTPGRGAVSAAREPGGAC